MKKILVFAVALMLLFSLSSAAFARTQHKNLLLSRIVIIEDRPIVSASIAIKNQLSFDFDNGKAVVLVPELGLRSSRSIDADSGRAESAVVTIGIPEDAPSGDYYVRVVVSNEDVKRVRHRLVTIK